MIFILYKKRRKKGGLNVKMYQKLRKYRESRGVTQTYIAKRTGKSNQRISALETGNIRLTVDEFEELCVTGYGVNPKIFFDDNFLKIIK